MPRNGLRHARRQYLRSTLEYGYSPGVSRKCGRSSAHFLLRTKRHGTLGTFHVLNYREVVGSEEDEGKSG